MKIHFKSIRRVTHEEDRKREAEYWASKTIAERVLAGWALADDDLLLRKNDEPEERTTWTIRRIQRNGR